MKWKEPVNSEFYKWTTHAKEKMREYGLSATRIKLVVKNPMRVEENFIENVVLAMQPQSLRRDKKTGKKVWSSEIWVMFKFLDLEKKVENIKIPEKFKNLFEEKKTYLIISAWKYPGVSEINDNLPIEMEKEIYESINENKID